MELGSANAATKWNVKVELLDNCGKWLWTGHHRVPIGTTFGNLLKQTVAEFHYHAAHELMGRVVRFSLLGVSAEHKQVWPFSTVSGPCIFCARSADYCALRA